MLKILIQDLPYYRYNNLLQKFAKIKKIKFPAANRGNSKFKGEGRYLVKKINKSFSFLLILI